MSDVRIAGRAGLSTSRCKPEAGRGRGRTPYRGRISWIGASAMAVLCSADRSGIRANLPCENGGIIAIVIGDVKDLRVTLQQHVALVD